MHPAGWYPTGEAGPDGQPLERWWDGMQWSPTVRPLGSGAPGPRLGSRAKALIAAGVVVALAGGGIGAYFALRDNNGTSANAASSNSPSAPTTGPGNGLGGGNGGNGNGNGNGGNGGGLGGGGLGGASPSPMPTVTGGGGQTVADPIDGLTIPVPGGWTGTSGSATGQGSWPALSTGPYTCPSGLTPTTGASPSAAAKCTRAGVGFSTTSGSAAQAVVTADIATLAGNNYGNLASHSVVNQGAITVAGRAGYQITWSVVPNYTGPSGTVEVIALPVPSHSGYFTLIDIGVDQNPQAPSLSSVNTQIISNITAADATGA